MTTFTDGKSTITIRMLQLDPEREELSGDISDELFDTGCLETADNGAYYWFDLPGLIALALDWKYSLGDFHSDSPVDPGLRCVWVNEEYLTRQNHIGGAAGTLDPITRQPVHRFKNEMFAANLYLDTILSLCEELRRICSNISDAADSRLVSEMLTEIRRAKDDLVFANKVRWRNAK